MSVVYTYTISALPNARVTSDRLSLEIAGANIPLPLHIETNVADDELSIAYAIALSAGDKTILDGVVAAHQGAPGSFRFHGSSKYVEFERSIPSTSWTVLGGAVTNIGFFIGTLSLALGRLTGGYKTSGGKAELRLVEVQDDGTETVLNSVAWELPDSLDVWKSSQFTTDVPPNSGEHTFRLEGRLVDATSASVRFVSLSILEGIL